MRALLAWLAVGGVVPAVAAVGVSCGGGSNGGQPGGQDASVDGTSAGEGGAHEGGAMDAPSDAGPTETGATVDGGAGVAFCDATYGALRAAFDGCCTSGDKTTDPFKFIDAIYSVLTQHCEDSVSSAIAKGRVTFDATAAAACEAEYQQRIAGGNCWLDVDLNQAGPPPFASAACTHVVTGLQAAGAPCAIDFECQDGLTCVGWTGGSDGTCASPGDAGGKCEQAPDAGSAFYFDYGLGSHPSCNAGAYCVTPACKAQGGAGAACTSDDACKAGTLCLLGKCSSAGIAVDGGACNAKSDCQQGLYCMPADGGALPGACIPRQPLGGACTSTGDQCKGICEVPDGGTSGVCGAFCGSG